MSITILIDLDDTLLINPINSFMPLYLKLLSTKLAPYISPDKMVKQLLAATEQMVASRSPERTLEQTFDAHFYPALDLQKSEIAPIIDGFYQNEFSELQKVTSPRPEAIQLIEYAAAKGHTLIVATNPLFPQSAMQARLSWAGFANSNYPFRFVTSYESMHFSKPEPAYYAEILGKHGFPHAPICMIGNSLKEDIVPTSLLGIPGFWVDGKPELLPESLKGFTAAGKLDEIIPWLESLEEHPHEIELNNTQAVMGILCATPAVLSDLTATLSEVDWKKKRQSSELSVLELISHLLDVETEINIPRINDVLSIENPFIVGIDSDTWVEQRNYQSNRSPKVISDLLKQRMTCIHALANLTEQQWHRPARHSFFGPTTLFELVKFVAVHDIDHIRQVKLLISSS